MQQVGAIDRTQLPADIRAASTENQQKYAAAQQFEQMLVQKMMTQATSLLSDDSGDAADAGGGDGEEQGGATDAVSAHYKELLPELMAKAMTTGDGVGIARDLYNAMEKQP